MKLILQYFFHSFTEKVNNNDMVDGNAPSNIKKEAETHRSPKCETNVNNKNNQCAANEQRTQTNEIMQTNKSADDIDKISKNQKSNKNNSKSTDCDNLNKNVVNYERENATINVRPTGLDNEISFELGIDDDEDPYAELESYLEKVKVSILVFKSIHSD